MMQSGNCMQQRCWQRSLVALLTPKYLTSCSHRAMPHQSRAMLSPCEILLLVCSVAREQWVKKLEDVFIYYKVCQISFKILHLSEELQTEFHIVHAQSGERLRHCYEPNLQNRSLICINGSWQTPWQKSYLWCCPVLTLQGCMFKL